MTTTTIPADHTRPGFDQIRDGFVRTIAGQIADDLAADAAEALVKGSLDLDGCDYIEAAGVATDELIGGGLDPCNHTMITEIDQEIGRLLRDAAASPNAVASLRAAAELPEPAEVIAAKMAILYRGLCKHDPEPEGPGTYCNCWGDLAYALQGAAGYDFDGSAQEAADLWDLSDAELAKLAS